MCRDTSEGLTYQKSSPRKCRGKYGKKCFKKATRLLSVLRQNENRTGVERHGLSGTSDPQLQLGLYISNEACLSVKKGRGARLFLKVCGDIGSVAGFRVHNRLLREPWPSSAVCSQRWLCSVLTVTPSAIIANASELYCGAISKREYLANTYSRI